MPTVPPVTGATEGSFGPTTDGSVLLDIGGDIGALVILTPDSLAGCEIELSPVGADQRRTHVAVRERRGSEGSRFAAVFPGLTAGDYTVWHPGGGPAGRVTVQGGSVTHLDWDTIAG